MLGVRNICFLFLLTVLGLTDGQKKCCEVCSNGTEKYYSIPWLFKNNCGESCIKPEDYKKYKLFEPGLTLANSSYPCSERGYLNYEKTNIHGFGPLKVAIDFYKKKN